MKRTLILAVTAWLALPILATCQTSTDGLAMADLSDKMEQLGEEMEGLGEKMEGYGAEMEKHGKELEKAHGDSPKAEQQMEALGEKMEQLGKQMEALGEQMEAYGNKMGKLHQDMLNWFFRELKKDGLIASLNGNARILFDEKGLDVDGKKASDELFRMYKSGMEKYWGRSLKQDFLFFFKGTVSEKNGNIQTSGNMNSDF